MNQSSKGPAVSLLLVTLAGDLRILHFANTTGGETGGEVNKKKKATV